ncbi:FeoA family protein [Vagococcus vulneris]|uniref:Ferrous iron transporter FeoA-like domain-containing protein n=1 Tax=Vagococcus vulneris TaxID=1977869 RepID=A0A429ZYT9_9ENTE|nr:ferrous iron transport protein A [Vagococcus vulneris]RST99157.1 hypothetical protein CBF37_05680 [Vagococcus vulneris]
MNKLIDGKESRAYQFLAFEGDEAQKNHLKNLGLVKGTTLYIVSKVKHQPLIVLFKGIRIGLDESIAKNILIEEKTDEEDIVTIPLSAFSVGQETRVVKLIGTKEVKRRLLDMGLTRGTLIKIKKIAPLGDPIEITVRNYELTLRKQEAEHIIVEGDD